MILHLVLTPTSGLYLSVHIYINCVSISTLSHQRYSGLYFASKYNFYPKIIHYISACAGFHHSTKTKTIFSIYLLYFSKQMYFTQVNFMFQSALESLMSMHSHTHTHTHTHTYIHTYTHTYAHAQSIDGCRMFCS